MSKFMLLLHDSPAAIQTFRQLSPEQMQKAVDKYMAWTKKPFCVDSKRLSMDAGRVIRSENGTPRVIDGPYSETKEVLGHLLLKLGRREEAAGCFHKALTCPCSEPERRFLRRKLAECEGPANGW